jgi:hypothetical protein
LNYKLLPLVLSKVIFYCIWNVFLLFNKSFVSRSLVLAFCEAEIALLWGLFSLSDPFHHVVGAQKLDGGSFGQLFLSI